MLKFLIFVSIIFGIIGFLLIFRAFYIHTIIHPDKIKITPTQKKSIILEILGVCLLFCSGIIVIYFYSLQSPNDRIIEEIRKEDTTIEKLPDISFRSNEK
jgi:hypothetical protein